MIGRHATVANIIHISLTLVLSLIFYTLWGINERISDLRVEVKEVRTLVLSHIAVTTIKLGEK